VCICGVSTEQSPSTPSTLFERTRQSAWLNTVTTPVDKKRVNSCVYKHLFFWGISATKKIATKTLKCYRPCATHVTLSKFVGWCSKKNPGSARFFETRLRVVWINSLIHYQQALLDQLGARFVHTESLGHVHLNDGVNNASLFAVTRKEYSNSRETKEADLRF